MKLHQKAEKTITNILLLLKGIRCFSTGISGESPKEGNKSPALLQFPEVSRPLNPPFQISAARLRMRQLSRERMASRASRVNVPFGSNKRQFGQFP
ncbi:hypothetical protein CDAR_46131 [Caerostris darwini]|uniref:Uncharacterized protein n=1 Tax=Caerostris darwini TaxID=1538125 RepID=A0AAV4U1B1_9ARAC|nr:hypothetical protein CDAR_46131 [Caerostris darwini]